MDAELVEGDAFSSKRVELSHASEFTHFLDGAQRSHVALYFGLHAARLVHTSAALLRRTEKRVDAPTDGCWLEGLQLFAPQGCPTAGWPCRYADVDNDSNPQQVADEIRRLIEQDREGKEVELGSNFQDDGWLLVDGGIGTGPNTAGSS